MDEQKPQWTPDDLNGQRVEFRFGNDPEMRIGEFVVTKGAGGKDKVEIVFYLPNPYQRLTGDNRWLELAPQHIAQIRIHPGWEAADLERPKFLLLA